MRARGLRRTLGSGADAFTVMVPALDLAPGDRIAMTGPSGCGKSTMLALLALALRPDAAEVLSVGEMDAAALWRDGRLDALGVLRGRAIGFVPQTGGLLPYLTLRANIALPLDLLGRSDPARVGRLADALDIGAALDRRPADVSVGQRQRAAVARAVVHGPALLLADEPTASVHPAQAAATMRLLTGMAAESGAALLVATHDPALAEAAGLHVAPVRSGEGQSMFAYP